MSNKKAVDVASYKRPSHSLVPNLRFPEFAHSEEWSEIELGMKCQPVDEKVGTTELTPVSITAGVGFVSQVEKFGRDISGDQYKNYTYLRKGDFAYNKGNSKKFQQGYVCQLKEFDEAAASSAFICFQLNHDCEPEFFQGLFDRNWHGYELSRYITSGARSDGLLNIKTDDFFRLKMPIPPSEEEQSRIANCLTSISELIADETQKLHALERHMSGLLAHVFPQPGELTPRLRLKKFRGSKQWSQVPLRKIATYENGKAHEPYITKSGEYVVVNARFISTNGAVQKYTNNALIPSKKGDVLMVLSDLPNGRALAKCYFVDRDGAYTVNQRVSLLRPKQIHDRFFYYAMNRHPSLLSFDDGMNQTHLRKDAVLDCPVWLPKEKDEQLEIANLLHSLDVIILSQTARIDELNSFKRGLLQNLFPAPKEAG